jgi:threonine dehydratase
VNVPSLIDVYAARRRLAGAVVRTPLLRSLVGGDTGPEVWLKLECVQVTRSFKIRGALNAVRCLAEQDADGRLPTRVVTASAGNHGLALAWAAARAGSRAVVFAPRRAPRAKLDAIGRAGAELRAEADDYDHAERLALGFAAEHAAPYVSPYNDPAVIAGAGTAAIEVMEDLPAVDALVVPTGGGGLLSGVAIVARGLAPGVRVVGVEAEHNPAFTLALARGAITPFAVRPTIADGLGGNLEAGSMTFAIVRDLVDTVVTVSEDEIAGAMRLLAATEHLVAEGAGAVGVAAVLATKLDPAIRRAAVLVTGANVDLATLLAVVTPRG